MSLVLSSLPVFASAADKTKLTRDTVITESNINEVLTSLGFDPTTSLGEKLDTVRIITVGELHDEIAKAKKMPKVIKVNSVEKDSTTIVETSSTGNISTMAVTQTGTVALTKSMSLGTTTNIRQTVLGDYSIVSGVKTWTGCRNPHVYVDAVLPWALSGYDLVYISWCDAGYTSTMITVNSHIGVNYWILVLGFKFYPGTCLRLSGLYVSKVCSNICQCTCPLDIDEGIKAVSSYFKGLKMLMEKPVRSKWGQGPLMEHKANYSPYTCVNPTIWYR